MTPLPRSTDVFVIGGGPAGLAAAIAARRRGLDVTVADCSVPPIDKACGEGIMPDGLAATKMIDKGPRFSIIVLFTALILRVFPKQIPPHETCCNAKKAYFPNGTIWLNARLN